MGNYSYRLAENLSGGKIAALENTEWEFSKQKIGVCEPEEDGKKKRCRAMDCRTEVYLENKDAEIIWSSFERFSIECGLGEIERLKNNEEIGRYQFDAKCNDTGDEFSVSVILPGEWNVAPAVSLWAWIGARYRNIDLQ